VSWLHGSDPMTYEELSLLVRTGVAPQEIVNDAARRKLLQPLTTGQQESLRESGAPPALLNALQSATLVASEQEVVAYRAHHQAAARPSALAALPPAGRATPAALQAVVLPDRFTEGLEAAKSVPEQPVKGTDAFNLSQLADAKAQALRDRKPLGFIMTSSTMFDKPVTTRAPGGSSALLHFYQAFKDSLVLVFVPIETKVDQLPPAVSAGFTRKEMGGVAPNMAVVDATANALVVAVPCGNAKTSGPDRDKVFVIAAAAIQHWLSYHPMAIGEAPTAGQAPR
jgi:hypothetical protein